MVQGAQGMHEKGKHGHKSAPVSFLIAVQINVGAIVTTAQLGPGGPVEIKR